MPKNLKVFHGLRNYGTQAGLFSKELRKQGIIAISVVHPDNFDRQVDIQLDHHGFFLKDLSMSLWNYIRRIKWFIKYNTFHFYFGKTMLPNQWDLPLYRLFGKKVIMEYLGNDIRHYESLVKRYNLPESHDYYQRMEEHDNKVRRRVQFEQKYIDYLISCLPTHIDFAKEYSVEVKEVLPLALDISSIEYNPLQKKRKSDGITILHAPTNRVFKGTKYVQAAIDQLKKEGHNIEFRLVEGITHKQLMEEYINCDILIDQISVGWYATAALEAMAVGRPTCAFIDQRYFQYIDYSDEIPVINVTKENIVAKLRQLINNKDELLSIGEKSRLFVEKHHDIKNVTKKLIKIYQEKVKGGKKDE